MSFFDWCKEKASDLADGLRGSSEEEESELLFLHGKLRVHVLEAADLPDTDTAFFNFDRNDLTDPFVVGRIGSARIFKSRSLSNEVNPLWDEVFHVYVCHNAAALKIVVQDKEHVGEEEVGSCSIPAEDLLGGETVEGWFTLLKGETQVGTIHLSVTYTPKDQLGENVWDVDDAYFSAKEKNRVVLYQDADTPPFPVFDGVLFPDGSPYKPPCAWKDLFKAIQEAQKFIYITGWSVFTETSLLRGDDDPDNASNVGELLKQKAEEGVRVLLLIWNEKMSTERNPGLMGTHDEETRLFFEGTRVQCVLVSRVNRRGFLANEFVGTCYTHHQKTVILDAEGSDGSREVVAFIGGLDITDGRFDNPSFPLWSTIHSLHKADFYNNCVPGVTRETGPRQPWHDCHARVQGPVALDIMKNFEERWQTQAEDNVQSLLHLSSEEFSLEPDLEPSEHEGGHWTCQLFRSITSDSCLFDFRRFNLLHSKGGRYVEDSILRSMVQHIRNAERFIYMENQYFLGSSYSWFADQEAHAMHIVPREITQKIVDKIAQREPFKIYVVIPMFPEGDPASTAVQEILFWQYRTMEAMYHRVAKAIREAAIEGHPTDYLSFFCLAKRESPDEMGDAEFADPLPGTDSEIVRKSRRHCIYVHSKMTIFDDEYILVGSANVNQRSLGGNRDSEIALGAYQPEHTRASSEEVPRGGIHSYRMALWAAHLGGVDGAYEDPGSDDCLAKVREVTSQFWELYTAEEPEHSDVHLLPYPVKVDKDGTVMALDEPWDCFPDTKAKVIGARSGFLPRKLTT